MEIFYAHGKLLISAEYLILDGALGLAIPTSYGQRIEVIPTNNRGIEWKSYDSEKELWFESTFEYEKLKSDNSPSSETRRVLTTILLEIHNMSPSLFAFGGFEIRSFLDFPRDWGLGSSSTLIYCLAQWAKINAFELSDKTLGGSGYDIACAGSNSPILYRRNPKEIKEVDFNPPFKDELYFVHLNKKQNSREGIKNYKKIHRSLQNEIKVVSEITSDMLSCSDLKVFEQLIKEHENLISGILDVTPVKEDLFSDYYGAIKSLGAWGGDFLLVTGDQNTENYFKKKGFSTVIPFDEMILK